MNAYRGHTGIEYRLRMGGVLAMAGISNAEIGLFYTEDCSIWGI